METIVILVYTRTGQSHHVFEVMHQSTKYFENLWQRQVLELYFKGLKYKVL